MTQGRELWKRYNQYHFSDRSLGFALDVSRVRFDDDYLASVAPAASKAVANLAALESGSIANPDENRMVGHYWLRDPSLAPTETIASDIRATVSSVRDFARQVHEGTLAGQDGPFRELLHIGIGGSALGPQFVADALGSTGDHLSLHFIDNTDPDGIARVLERLGPSLGRTLVSVVSKSGGTPEPRNGMLATQAAYKKANLDFARHAIAITMDGSKLGVAAKEQGWLASFPMWDWVGGRTSVMSTVGLVPAALQGIDIDDFLEGAAAMDRLTRAPEPLANPALLLALMWYRVGGGRGEKDMVILPYKDRLMLFSRYLQQLVMESLGKEFDRSGIEVNQGIAVYGNKGSTDQHAYVQQLRDGVPNFFVTFIQVLCDRSGGGTEAVEGRAETAGDYLFGFLQGTREALHDKGRDSITISIESVTPRSLGALIALYERAVGLYAELINVNAYHQPGVEAGKKAAAAVLELQRKITASLGESGKTRTAQEVAADVGEPEAVETVFKILEHLAANPGRGVTMESADPPEAATFQMKSG